MVSTVYKKNILYLGRKPADQSEIFAAVIRRYSILDDFIFLVGVQNNNLERTTHVTSGLRAALAIDNTWRWLLNTLRTLERSS